MRSRNLLLSIVGISLLSCVFAVAENREIKHHRFVHSWNDGEAGTRCLRIEVLDDDLIHFEIFERREPGHADKCLRENDMIWISPMVDGENRPENYFDANRGDYSVSYREGYQGPNPTAFRRHDDGVETEELRVRVYNDSRCINIYDKARGAELTSICAEDLNRNDKRLQVEKKGMFNFYGVGNLFTRNHPNGDWKGIVFDAAKKADKPGNLRGPTFYNGDPSTSQFPMVYALGEGKLNYGLFFDQVYRMTADFTQPNHYTYETYGDEIRFFILSGPDLKDLRSDFLQLTGRPPVAPMSQFGHWTSKFGFKSWGEIEEEVSSLRKNGIPVDGVALDLQWFGGRFGDPEVFRMGVLQFYEPDFPNPQEKVKEFYRRYGVHFMPIEESYIDERLDEHRALCDSNYRNQTPGFKDITSDHGCFLARNNLDFDAGQGGWNATDVSVDFKRSLAAYETVWWGKGGMLDHTNPHGRHFWHQLKRRWLSRMGIFNHWLDLGEPEMFYEYAYYRGFPELYREHQNWNGQTVKNVAQKHGDVHNVYNLFWVKGIEEGYSNGQNHDLTRAAMRDLYERNYTHHARHWTMSRAGTVGSQRYGAMWTGDTRGNFENLNGHLQTQMHMSLLGLDYYSADAGGFFHVKDGKDPKDHFDATLYKQWFANASLLDLPLRPHGWALEDGISYGAHIRGHLDSNRANVWRRYELIPYLYSLAHRANRFGEPIFPPLVYHFQEDLTVRENGTEKMIGPSLLFRVVAEYGNPEPHEKAVYLPKGTWVDYESLQWHDSKGGLTKPIPLFRRERVPASEPSSTYYFMNPLFARAGAIIPKQHVDFNTMNTLGKRWGGPKHEELILRIFADATPTEFTLYEDDGVSRGYQSGQVRTTKISQVLKGDVVEVTVGAAQGDFEGAAHDRPVTLEVIVRDNAGRGRLIRQKLATSNVHSEQKVRVNLKN